MTTPTLSDDRVDAMRTSVMHAVDHDIRRRGRRARRGVGLGLASVLVVGLGGYTLTAVDPTASDGSASSASDSASREGPAEPGAVSGFTEDSAGGSSTSTSKQPAPDDVDQDREVITTGDVSVTVKDPRGVVQQVSAYVESIGGRVDSRAEDGSGKDASATVTVRVPSTKVTATIDRLKTYGVVNDVSLQNEDVTAQATDLDARIDALQLSISRLEKIMGNADTSNELIKAEDALTSRQEQLESLQAERKRIDDQVSLSTLSITLSQNERVDTVEPGGFTGGLRDGWNGLVSALNGIVEVAGRALPWAAVLLVLFGAYRLVARRRDWN